MGSDFIPLDSEQVERNFCEIAPAFTSAQARIEADRCLYCYDAPCTRACPTHIDVPAFIKKIASGNVRGSARVIFDANPIGASCARVCPTEALCEGACVEGTLLKKPIEIGRLQRHATDYAAASPIPLFVPGAPLGKSVAIVGAGPAGLSCAVYLARLGYAVTVYDRRELPGGLNTYGMAEYKMPQRVALEEAGLARSLGVRFELGRELTPEAVEQLQAGHDAVFVAIGLGATARLGIAGEDLPGVWDALPWIERIKTRNWATVPVGQTVVVIGAGNTAVDAATQSKRLGARRVIMVYRRGEAEMPAYPYEYELAKTDGVEFRWYAAPVGIVAAADGAGVAALRCVTMVPGEPDASGRRGVTALPNSEFEIPCDMVIKAVGQSKLAAYLTAIPGVETHPDGRVKVDPATMATGNPKIFAGGDCVNGGREAVDAAQMGKVAAMGIHYRLTGERVALAGGPNWPLAAGGSPLNGAPAPEVASPVTAATPMVAG